MWARSRSRSRSNCCVGGHVGCLLGWVGRVVTSADQCRRVDGWIEAGGCPVGGCGLVAGKGGKRASWCVTLRCSSCSTRSKPDEAAHTHPYRVPTLLRPPPACGCPCVPWDDPSTDSFRTPHHTTLPLCPAAGSLTHPSFNPHLAWHTTRRNATRRGAPTTARPEHFSTSRAFRTALALAPGASLRLGYNWTGTTGDQTFSCWPSLFVRHPIFSDQDGQDPPGQDPRPTMMRWKGAVPLPEPGAMHENQNTKKST